jgi:hypothetical protein
MLRLFRRTDPEPAAARISAALQTSILATAWWHAFRSLQLDAAGDPDEARAHLLDAGEFLAQIGGPARPESAEAIFQWCAAREVGEA